MSKSSSIAAAATLALAALPMLALAGAAHAQSVAVKVGDLNLSTPAGQKTLQHRTEIAVRDFCRSDRRSIATYQNCADGVRAEVAEKAVTLMQPQYAAR